MRVWILVGLLVFSGCSASMVSTRGAGDSKYAPVNDAKGGTVSYLNQGAKGVIQSRRNDAYKKMHDFCKGEYRIAKEYPRDKGSFGVVSPAPWGATTLNDSSEYIYIDFECVVD